MIELVELVFVDFDDTIVNTSPRFAGARRQLFELLATAGFAADEVERLHHDEIDPQMRTRYGFGPQRLEHAFRETYDQLRLRAGHDADDLLAERCAALGRGVAGTPPLFDGAIAALQRLASTHPTVLYTQSGDIEYQLSCVRGAGIHNVLPEDRIRIAAHKGREDFATAMQHYQVKDPAGVWMIGNSMRSDINPALESGAHAILIEVDEPWHYDVVEPASEHFHTAPTFAAAVDLLLRLAPGTAS